MSDGDYGALAAALSKAQASFPAIPRDKSVTVQTKAGSSYSFKYAPLDSILEKVRKPLADNGLAIAQTIDGTDLVTMLLHSAGASLTGRAPLPQNISTVQEMGSAVTYLRRYSLQAMLGIAAEEDDDGNHASGNYAQKNDATDAAVARAGFLPPAEPGTLIGIPEVGKSQDSDFELRQTPKGYRIGFRLVQGRSGIKSEATGSLAEQIAEYRSGIEGQNVTCWGSVREETFTPKGAEKPVTYRVLTVTRLKVGTLDLTEPDVEDAATDANFDEGWLAAAEAGVA